MPAVRSRTSRHRPLVLLLTASLAATTPALPRAQELPSLGEAGAESLSPADERRLGEQIMQEVRRDPAYLDDPDAFEYVQHLGYRLVAASTARHADFEFFVLRDPSLNAFALPGGFIGVHSGLLLAAQGESELASVIAHEIGHVQQRHIARMLGRQRDAGLIAVGSLLLALLAARSGSASSGPALEAAITVGQAAALQQQLNFSRENEREADRVGFGMLVDAGFDPRGMSLFFGRLQQGTRMIEGAAPAYLRTHPLTVERIADIQNRIQASRVRQVTDGIDFHLVRARLRVLQIDSTEGREDSYAYFATRLRERSYASEPAAHYGLAFAALRLGRPREAVIAAEAARRSSPGPSAMLDKLASEAAFAAARGPAERAAAIAQAREATGRYPLSRLTAMHYVDLLQRAHQDDTAVAFLREQVALARTDPAYFRMIAASYGALNRRTLQHQAIGEMYLLLGSIPAAAEQFQLARRAADADFYVLSEVDARLRQISSRMQEQRDAAGRSGRPQPDGERSGRRPG